MFQRARGLITTALMFGALLCLQVGDGLSLVWAEEEALGKLPVQERAAEILSSVGLTAGMVVHVGCGDGQLTHAIYATSKANMTVQGLDARPAMVQQARTFISGQGDYGPVSAETLIGSKLPYADELVNLVVDESGAIPTEELLRVIAPGGSLCRLIDGKLTTTLVA